MIKMTMEAENFAELITNLCDMLETMGALEVQEVQKKYKLTQSIMWRKMGEYDLEMGALAAADLMQHKYNAMSLSELPLDNWHEYYELMERTLEDKRYDAQTEDWRKELAW